MVGPDLEGVGAVDPGTPLSWRPEKWGGHRCRDFGLFGDGLLKNGLYFCAICLASSELLYHSKAKYFFVLRSHNEARCKNFFEANYQLK